MKDLIEALQIFLKYRDEKFPTHCEHDELWVVGFTKDEVSSEDAARLDVLGFVWSENDCSWVSFRYGSA